MKKNLISFFPTLLLLPLLSCSGQGTGSDKDQITFRANTVTLAPESYGVSGSDRIVLQKSGNVQLAVEPRGGGIYIRSKGEWHRVVLSTPKNMINVDLLPDTAGGMFVTAAVENNGPGVGSLRNFDALLLKLDSTGSIDQSFGNKGALIIDHDGLVESIHWIRFENNNLTMIMRTSKNIDDQRLSLIRASAPWNSSFVSVTPLPITGHFEVTHLRLVKDKLLGVLKRYHPKDNYGVDRSLPTRTSLFTIPETGGNTRMDSLTLKDTNQRFAVHKLLDFETGMIAVTRNYLDTVSLWNAFKVSDNLAIDNQFGSNGYLFANDVSLKDPFDLVVHGSTLYAMTFGPEKDNLRTLTIETYNASGKKTAGRPIQVEIQGFKSKGFLVASECDGATLFFVTTAFRSDENQKPILHRVDLKTGEYSFKPLIP